MATKTLEDRVVKRAYTALQNAGVTGILIYKFGPKDFAVHTYTECDLDEQESQRFWSWQDAVAQVIAGYRPELLR